MSRTRLIAAALLALFVLTACNTVQGIGRDVKSAGDAIEDAGD